MTPQALARTAADLAHLATTVDQRLPATLTRLREYQTGPRAASLEPGRTHQASSPVEQAAGQPDPARIDQARLTRAITDAHQNLEEAHSIVRRYTPPDAKPDAKCSSCGTQPAHLTTAGHLTIPATLCQTCKRFVVNHGRLPDQRELNQRAAGGQMRVSASSRPA